MAARKRIVKKLPEFRLPADPKETEEQDLKKEKARAITELRENEKNKQEWFDKELDKNLKNIK